MSSTVEIAPPAVHAHTGWRRSRCRVRDRGIICRRERGVVQSQRAEDPLLEGVGRRHAGQLLDQHAQQDDVGVAVLVLRSGREVHRMLDRDVDQLLGCPGLLRLLVQGLVGGAVPESRCLTRSSIARIRGPAKGLSALWSRHSAALALGKGCSRPDELRTDVGGVHLPPRCGIKEVSHAAIQAGAAHT
jgi:hypothetical protein